jgi:hypothetical protein
MRAGGLAAVAVAVAVGACGCGVRPATTAALRSANPAWAKAQARFVARLMLARQPLPPHAVLQPSHARPRTLQAAEKLGTIDINSVYLVPRPEARLINFLKSHVPSGSANVGYGYVTSGATVERFVDYMLASQPEGVADALLVASMLPATRGRTWLRIDAQVAWRLPRSAAEHVDPGRYRAVLIVYWPGPGPAAITPQRPLPAQGTITKVVTALGVIAELAGKLNRMPTSGASGSFCPAFFAGYRLTFEPRHGSAGRVLASAEPCDSVQLSVGGRSEPLLADTTGLGLLVDRLLGVG